MAELNLKKYTIQITTKGTEDIMCGMIDIADGVNAEEVLDNITSDNFDFCDLELNDGTYIELDYIACQCIGDEYRAHFELKVLDEEGNVVFITDNFKDLKMVVDPSCFLRDIDEYYENEEERPDDELLQRMQKVMLEQYEKDKEEIREGYCALIIDYRKWEFLKFEIEDDEFNPNKLLFISNPQLNGACFDYYTDKKHVMYGDKILEDIEEDYTTSNYGCTRYLAIRHKDTFEIIREVD